MTLDNALRALKNTPDNGFESRMRAGLAARKAGLDLDDWAAWMVKHGHAIDLVELERKWWLFGLVSDHAFRCLFLMPEFAEAA
ncbi:hypothetical protein [Paraburkholderia sp. HD33-4]|uniref:hypothetical protein n=1 Tax=Paraburkholderia sp. HD33-4 TaxID=2883242 RepID=UPI001F2CCBF2|nr:hypothetical protein [Paraburkholderia sp. HD33-4]